MRARRIRPGDTCGVTRRTRDRRFSLAPSSEVNEAIGYFLAVLTERHQIELSAITVLSDHYHNVNHDPGANLPAFNRDFHHLLTRQLNAMFGKSGPMWDSRQTNHVRPVTPDDTLRRIAYTMANPVHHGLVKFAKSWPGLRMCWGARPRTFKRPRGYLDVSAKRPDGSPKWPEFATLKMHRPPGFDGVSDSELAMRISNAITSAEDDARAEMAAAGRQFIGRRNIRRMSRSDRAQSQHSTSDITPRIACRDPLLRAEAIAEERDWVSRHGEAIGLWRAGDRGVLFPYGTYKMRVVHCANVAGPD